MSVPGIEPNISSAMVAAIGAGDSNDRTIALTDDASAIHKITTDGSLTRRWASEPERAQFRELSAKYIQTPLLAGNETTD
jgi:hypothetical protein